MHSAIARNRRTTVILIAAYIAVMVAVGVGFSFLFSSIWPVIVLSVLTALHVTLAWFRTAAFVDRALKGVSVTRRDEPRLYNVIETLAIRNGMPMPKIEVDESDDINAYALGMRPEKAIVGATRGALTRLDPVELEAVMAHEMAHIKNGDTRGKLLVVGLVEFMQLIAMLLMAFIIGAGTSGNRGGKNSGGGILAVLAVIAFAFATVFLVVGYIIGPIVKSGVSRQREYLADASGVEMTRFPPAFVSFFRKLEDEEIGAGASGALSIFYTYRRPRRGLMYLFTATHPPTWRRIERIEEMAESM